MTISAHPSPALRQDYARGQVSPGVALALEAHLALCPVCALATDSLGRARRRAPAAAQPRGEAHPEPSHPAAEDELSASLEARRSGRWRRLSPRLKLAPLGGVSGLGEAVRLLNAAPGASLAPLASADVEVVVALEGAARSGQIQYGPGDLLENPAEALRRAEADPVQGFRALVVSVDSWPPARLPRLATAVGLKGRRGSRRAR